MGLGYRMDLVFYLIRLGLFYMDHDLITVTFRRPNCKSLTGYMISHPLNRLVEEAETGIDGID